MISLHHSQARWANLSPAKQNRRISSCAGWKPQSGHHCLLWRTWLPVDSDKPLGEFVSWPQVPFFLAVFLWLKIGAVVSWLWSWYLKFCFLVISNWSHPWEAEHRAEGKGLFFNLQERSTASSGRLWKTFRAVCYLTGDNILLFLTFAFIWTCPSYDRKCQILFLKKKKLKPIFL